MKSKSCCGFGHREVFENITERINSAVREAAEQGCEIFYTGAMGQFDELFSASVRIMKKEYPNIKLICVNPYMTMDINKIGNHLYTLYDDVIIPSAHLGIRSPIDRFILCFSIFIVVDITHFPAAILSFINILSFSRHNNSPCLTFI